MKKTDVKALVVVAIILIIASTIRYCIRKQVYGQQITWTEVLIGGPSIAVISIIVAYLLWKRKGRDK
jgi:hypothetical protein